MQSENNQSTNRYQERGVSATKGEVHSVVDKMDEGLFPGAFCKITPDHLTGDPNKCNVIHSDGSGTKSTIAYLKYKETGDPSVFRGIAQDSIVMNIDDLLCIGAQSGILISSTVNRNARNFPGEALAELINGTEDFLQTMRDHGLDIHSGGGETADVGDLTPSVTVDSCAVAIMNCNDVISSQEVVPGLAIVGLESSGRANYENFENSGIGSNGLTSARHDLLCSYYKEKYPETFDPNTPSHLVYCGPYKLEDSIPGSELTAGEAILSPTRSYAPVIVKLLKEMRAAVKGIVHCSGGGQTKCIRFGQSVEFIKNNFMNIPPVFTEIQKHSKTSWREMFQVYNMGHRMEIYCPKENVNEVKSLSESFGIHAQEIGETLPSRRKDEKNHVTIQHKGQTFEYSL
jgi:phosphoribosylformylglycinamidine cyclo-ligase